ncbi:MAG TPA: GNAT family N-acetyltransferase [Nitrospirota bacterium]|jgi:hypothetical protein
MMEAVEEHEHDAWDDFVSRRKDATVFQTAWWHKAWGADVKVLAKKGTDGRIEGGMALHLSKFPKKAGAFGTLGLRRPPLTHVNGPVIAECGKTARSARFTHYKRELAEAVASLPVLGFYDISLGRYCPDAMPFIWNGFETGIGYTYVVPAGGIEGWWKEMSDKTRRAVKDARKKAAELGCTMDTDPPFSEVLPLLEETTEVKRFTLGGEKKRLVTWWDAVRSKDAGSAYLLRDGQGTGISAAILVRDGNASYCLANGMQREMRKDGHLNMLVFERMIADTISSGRDFDFCGSVLMGVERFFRGWGGELRTNLRVTKIPSAAAYITWNAYRYMSMHRRGGWVKAG